VAQTDADLPWTVPNPSAIRSKSLKCRGDDRAGYTVHLFGEDAIETFLARIAPHCVGPQDQVAQLRSHMLAVAERFSTEDTLPAEIWHWIDRERRRLELSWQDLAARAGLAAAGIHFNQLAHQRGFSRKAIARIAAVLGSERLAQAASSDVFWDRIVAIEPRGIEDTFDLTVDVDHNFVADGLIVHNSHSAAYALITYHTAYLKAHFPVEFMCATLTSDLGKIEKVVGTIAEARSMGISVLPPDVNESERQFAVIYEQARAAPAKRSKNPVDQDPYRPRIRVGLGGIKGVGDSAVEAILEARLGGSFKDLFDFCARVDIRRVNKGVLEALIQSGAFDESLKRTGASRAQAYASIDKALEGGRGAARDRASGQMGLFGATEILRPSSGYPQVEGWDAAEQLRRERSSLGYYLSGHPIDRYAQEVSRVATTTTAALGDLRDGTEVTLAGVIESYRERVPKSGGRLAFFELEDRQGRVEVIVRTKVYAGLESGLDREARQTVANTVLREGEAVLVSGKVQIDRRRDENGEIEEVADEDALERKLVLNTVTPLGEALKARTKAVWLRLNPSLATENRLRALRSALADHPGPCPVAATLHLPEGSEVVVHLPGELRVDPSEALVSRVERIFGEKVAELR
jgi:DNA polymerase III subunit alpha